MTILSEPDRCPLCHIPMEFRSPDYRRSKLPRTRLAAAIVTAIAGIAIGLAGIVLIQIYMGGEIKPALFRRRDESPLVVSLAVIVELGIVFIIARVIVRRLIKAPRVLSHRCDDCGTVHSYRVVYLPNALPIPTRES